LGQNNGKTINALGPDYGEKVIHAQLAAVDGSLVLTDKLDFVGFGSMLQAPHWEESVVIAPDPSSETELQRFAAFKYGSKHKSAIVFAGHNEKTVVFVIS
jgi:hypothetical protein